MLNHCQLEITFYRHFEIWTTSHQNPLLNSIKSKWWPVDSKVNLRVIFNAIVYAFSACLLTDGPRLLSLCCQHSREGKGHGTAACNRAGICTATAPARMQEITTHIFSDRLRNHLKQLHSSQCFLLFGNSLTQLEHLFSSFKDFSFFLPRNTEGF